MPRYIKVAKKKDPPDSGEHLMHAVGTNAGIGAAAAAGLGAIGAPAIAAASKEDPISKKEVDKLRKAMKANRVQITDMGEGAARSHGAAYMPPHVPRKAGGTGKAAPFYQGMYDAVKGMMGAEPDATSARRRGFASVPGGEKGSPHLMAHELGHASKANKKWSLRNPKWSSAVTLSRSLGPVASGIAAGTLAYKGKGESDDVGKEVRRGAAIGAAGNLVASSPHLFEEARASVRGARGLKAIGKSKKYVRRFGRNMAGAFGTYLIGAAAAGGAAGSVGAAIGRYKREQKAS